VHGQKEQLVALYSREIQMPSQELRSGFGYLENTVSFSIIDERLAVIENSYNFDSKR